MKFILIFLFLTSAHCFGCELEGIEFLTKKAESFNVTVKPGFDFSSGFTLCLRVMFYLLNPSIILHCPGTITLELKEYLPGRGVVQVQVFNGHCPTIFLSVHFGFMSTYRSIHIRTVGFKFF
jgi:hypothetical protein